MTRRAESQQQRIDRMKREILRRGGVVHLSGGLPPDVLERFLLEILACPECNGGRVGH